MVSFNGVSIFEQHPPTASAIVWKDDNGHIWAAKYNEKYDKWDRISKGESGLDDSIIIQSAIDTVYEKGGGNIFIKNNGIEYIIDKTIVPRKYCRVIGEYTKLRLADGAQCNVIELDDYCEIGHFIIDGNYKNNLQGSENWTSIDDVPFSNGIYTSLFFCKDLYKDKIIGDYVKTRGWYVHDIIINNTLRSSIVSQGEYGIIENCKLSNSLWDHLLYASSAKHTIHRNLELYGSIRDEVLSVGSKNNDIESAYYNIFENIYIHDIYQSGVSNNVLFGISCRYKAGGMNSFEKIKIFIDGNNKYESIYIGQDNCSLNNIYIQHNINDYSYTSNGYVIKLQCNNTTLSNTNINTSLNNYSLPYFSVISLLGNNNSLSNMSINLTGDKIVINDTLSVISILGNNDNISNITINEMINSASYNKSTIFEGITNDISGVNNLIISDISINSNIIDTSLYFDPKSNNMSNLTFSNITTNKHMNIYFIHSNYKINNVKVHNVDGFPFTDTDIDEQLFAFSLSNNRGILKIVGNGSSTTFTVSTPHLLYLDDLSKISIIATASKPCQLSYDLVTDAYVEDFKASIKFTLTFPTPPASGEIIYLSWDANVIM